MKKVRPRGRPPKTEPKVEPVEEFEEPIMVLPDKSQDGTANIRISGSMSLRPNKRVKLSKALKRMLESDEDDEDTDEAIEDVDMVSPEDEASDEFDDFIKVNDKDPIALDESAVQELSNRDSVNSNEFPKRARKKIMYNAKLAAQKRRQQLMSIRSDKKASSDSNVDILNTTYKDNKEWICVGCSTEIEQHKLVKCPNVFTGLTRKGKSLKDLLTSVIKENLDESMIGQNLCTSCFDALNHIEELYASFRVSVDKFLDNYLLGQKALDADLAGLQQIHDLNHLPGCINLGRNLEDIIIKVFFLEFR